MVLFRQRRVFVWAAAMMFAATALYALVGAKYEANMKILRGIKFGGRTVTG